MKKIRLFFIIATMVLGVAGLRAADGRKLEQQYAATLASLRAEIAKSVPKFDGQKWAAFLKVYEAEANAKAALDAETKASSRLGGSKDASAKATAAKVEQEAEKAYAQAQANSLAAAKPVLENLERFLTSDALDAKLIKCALLANATPRGLAEFARQGQEQEALMAKLLADDVLMKQMLVAGGAKDGQYGRAMQIYSDIQQASARAASGILQRLALGTSLEQAVPIKEFDLKTTVDPVKRYLNYEQAYLNGELDPAFTNMTAWECRLITDSDAPDEQIVWGREMLRNYRPDIILEPDYRWRYSKIVRTDVPYKNPEWTLEPHTYQQILNGGGKCGPRAWFGRFALRCFGIPTWGVRQVGHAALSHWTPDGWVVNFGAAWKFNWWEDRPGLDFLLETQARAHPQDYLKVLRAQWIGDALDEQKFNPMHPGSGGFWPALALNQERAIVADAKPVEVAPAGEDLAESNFSKQPENIFQTKVTTEDCQIGISSEGTITIPAVACSEPRQSTANIIFMKSFSGGMQLNCRQDAALAYDIEVSSAGKYALSARVVTVHKGQHLLLLPNAAGTPIDIAMPYTVGLWEETTPVETVLVKGKNTLRFMSKVPNYAMTIKQFALVPVK